MVCDNQKTAVFTKTTHARASFSYRSNKECYVDSTRRSPPKTLYIKIIYMSNHRGKIVLGQNLRLEAEASNVLQDPRFSTMTVETTEKVKADLVLLKHDGDRFLLRDRRIIFRATLDVGIRAFLSSWVTSLTRSGGMRFVSLVIHRFSPVILMYSAISQSVASRHSLPIPQLLQSFEQCFHRRL